MSFALTTAQIRNQTKTVTRRKGWLFLEVGDRIQAIVKGQGLKKGETVERLCVIEVVSVRRERLEEITAEDVVAEGFPGWSVVEFVDLYLKSFRRVFGHTGSIRRAGSAAIDLAYVACGRVDGFWEMALSSWDMAAAALLIQEAGGRVSDFFGGPTYLEQGHIVAGNPVVHRQLMAVVGPVFRGKLS